MSKFNYVVCQYGKQGKELKTLAKFESLQSARNYIKKKAESVRWGKPYYNGLAMQIYKIESVTEQPVTIYLD